MNKTIRRSLVGAFTAIALLCSIAIQPAHAYTPPVPGSSVMRLTAPLPGATNSVNLTPDAKGDWDAAYGKGLNARVMYADVRSTVLLTFKYTNAAGLPYTNRTVYLIVNKKFSCSKTTFSTTQVTNYPGGNRPNTSAIVRDWCGDQPQLGAGETAIQATTDAFGKATFNMKNYNITGEQFPKALNKQNVYSKGIPCGDDVMCMQTTIAPSLFPHPTEAQERGEDKDLIFLAFVNPKVTAAVATQKAKAGTTKTITFKLTNLSKKAVSGTTVTFESFGEGGQPQEYSVISNAQGVVTVKVAAPKGTLGLQVVRAKVYGAQIGTDSKIYWVK
jgi:hypothetical protein